MTPLVALIAAAALAVEAGWEPLADGGHQYTLQIEPSIIGLLENGNDVISEVPAQVHVRRLRVTIGTGAVTRIDGEPAAGQPQTTAAPPDEPRDHGAAAPTPAEEKFTMPAFPIDDETQHNPATPAGFSSQVNEARPLPTSADQQAQSHNAEKPRLDGEVLGTSASDASKPWMPLVIAAVLLCCSLGANLYLGWIAWEARARYRAALSRQRPAVA